MRDKIHYAVRRALEKDGWEILNDPYRLPLKNTIVRIDLEAGKMIEVGKGQKRILVEIKSLDYSSLLYSFYGAYGQYDFYREELEQQNINKRIYLATSMQVYEGMQNIPELISWLNRKKVNLLFVDLPKEKIVKWITY